MDTLFHKQVTLQMIATKPPLAKVGLAAKQRDQRERQGRTYLSQTLETACTEN